jgi:hypothetical protein
MANTILMKSLTSAATVPHATNGLKIAELGVNTYDGRIYLGTKIGTSSTAGGTATAATWVGAPILDEDAFGSNSATSLATQQSIKAYIDSNAGTGDITGVVLTTDDSNTASDTSGSAAFTIAGGAGIDTSASGTTVTIAGETASATNPGIVELATTAETTTGSDAARAVTPDGLKDGYQGSTNVTTLGTIATGTWNGTALATAYIANDAITADKIADDVIDSEHYAAGSIDLEHLSSQSVDEDNLYISNSGSNGQFLQKQSGNNGGLTWATAATSNTTYTAGDGLDLSGTEFSLENSTASNIGGVIVAGTANEIEVGYSGGTATVGLPDNVTIGGNLTVSGTTTTVNSTTVSIADPLFELGASGSDDNLDRGIIMKYNSSGAKKAFMGFDDSTGKFTMIADATDSSSVISGTAGTLVMTTFEGALTGNASGSSGSCTGNAATATALANARTINGTSFDGTGNITLGNDSVTNAMMADDAIDSAQIADGSIDTAHIANSQITSGLMAANSIDSASYVDGSIDTAHIANDQITNALMADDAIDSAQIANGAVDNVHLANSSITMAGVAYALGTTTFTAAVIAAAIDSEAMTLTNTTMNGGTYSTS